MQTIHAGQGGTTKTMTHEERVLHSKIGQLKHEERVLHSKIGQLKHLLNLVIDTYPDLDVPNTPYRKKLRAQIDKALRTIY